MKLIVPCDVCIKRFYRGYVTVDENASRDEIREAMQTDIIDNQDAVLIEDPNLDVEEHDIVYINPRLCDTWPEEE